MISDDSLESEAGQVPDGGSNRTRTTSLKRIRSQMSAKEVKRDLLCPGHFQTKREEYPNTRQYRISARRRRWFAGDESLSLKSQHLRSLSIMGGNCITADQRSILPVEESDSVTDGAGTENYFSQSSPPARKSYEEDDCQDGLISCVNLRTPLSPWIACNP
ncbi:hypothetical protein WAI453_011732 [Rhynchosporium graminicola]